MNDLEAKRFNLQLEEINILHFILPGLDKPARLIIRLFFGFASDDLLN